MRLDLDERELELLERALDAYLGTIQSEPYPVEAMEDLRERINRARIEGPVYEEKA
jgi:hypothetical protein